MPLPPRSRAHALGALTLALALAAAPTAAKAQSSQPLYGETLGMIAVVGPTGIFAGVLDGLIGYGLLSSGHVNGILATTGVVFWSVVSYMDLGIAFSRRPADVSLRGPGFGAMTLFSLGSLCLSIYALTRGPLPLLVAPAAFATPDHRPAAGLLVAGHF